MNLQHLQPASFGVDSLILTDLLLIDRVTRNVRAVACYRYSAKFRSSHACFTDIATTVTSATAVTSDTSATPSTSASTTAATSVATNTSDSAAGDERLETRGEGEETGDDKLEFRDDMKVYLFCQVVRVSQAVFGCLPSSDIPSLSQT